MDKGLNNREVTLPANLAGDFEKFLGKYETVKMSIACVFMAHRSKSDEVRQSIITSLKKDKEKLREEYFEKYQEYETRSFKLYL